MVHEVSSIRDSALPLIDRVVNICFSLPVNFDGETIRYVTIASPGFCNRMASESLDAPTKHRSYDWDLESFSHTWVTLRGTPDGGPNAWRRLALEVQKLPDREADEQYVKEVNQAYRGVIEPQHLL